MTCTVGSTLQCFETVFVSEIRSSDRKPIGIWSVDVTAERWITVRASGRITFTTLLQKRTMRFEILENLDAFRSIAPEWDSFWQKSSSHVAFHRAIPLIRFAETFGRAGSFRTILIRNGDRIVMGLPISSSPGILVASRPVALSIFGRSKLVLSNS